MPNNLMYPMQVLASAMFLLAAGLVLIAFDYPFMGSSLIGVLVAGNVTTTWHIAQHKMPTWYGSSWHVYGPRILVANVFDHLRHHLAEQDEFTSDANLLLPRFSRHERATHRRTPLWLHIVCTLHTIVLAVPVGIMLDQVDAMNWTLTLGYVTGAVVWRFTYEFGHWLTHTLDATTPGLLHGIYRATLHPDLHRLHHAPNGAGKYFPIFRAFGISDLMLSRSKNAPLVLQAIALLEHDLVWTFPAFDEFLREWATTRRELYTRIKP